jgi:prophage regulatory protein
MVNDMNRIYIRDTEFGQRLGTCRQTIWRLVKSDPTFPKPIRLTPGCTRWLLSEVEAWEASKRTPTQK